MSEIFDVWISHDYIADQFSFILHVAGILG